MYPSELLATIVRGWRVSADNLASVPVATLLGAMEHHGVGPLVAEQLADRRDVSRELREGLTELARREVAIDLMRTFELRACLLAFRRAEIPYVLMKGAQLAYTVYPRSDLRPRVDADILVPWAKREAIRDPLMDLGYAAPVSSPETLVMSQVTFKKTRAEGTVHALDVHWRIANPQLFAGYLEYDELSEAATPVRALGPGARGLSDIHALLVACVHRVAHHYDADNLIWLYDIHLLSARLDTDQWEAFRTLAAARGVSAICARSLDRANRAFGTAVPPGLGGSAGSERTTAYLEANRRHVAYIAEDVFALPRWGDRFRLIREHVLPPARYMRDVYAPRSVAPLPVLYIRRMVRGARKWLFRSA